MLESGNVERRSCERIAVETPVDLHMLDKASPHQNAVMINLSEHGAMIRGDIDLAPRQSITLMPTKVLMDHPIPSRVAWIAKGGSERVRQAGLQFMKPNQLVHALQA